MKTETEAIHLWFSLSYANYLVLPRSVLQSMPDEWQTQFVSMLDELHDNYGHLEWPAYNVQALAGPAQRVHEEECYECKGTGVLLDLEKCDDCEGTGIVECDRWQTPEEIGIITDPIPHYDRGRTRIPPRKENNE